MAKRQFTNKQAENMIMAMLAKAQKLAFANHKTINCMTLKDYEGIERILNRCFKRIP